MAIATLLIIFGYFLVRIAIPLSDFERTHSQYMTAFWKACLSCGAFALGSPLYLSELSTYDPTAWLLLPPVPIFLGWSVVVVIDSHYQFRLMGRTQHRQEETQKQDIKIS
jgi:hypothetical protein